MEDEQLRFIVAVLIDQCLDLRTRLNNVTVAMQAMTQTLAEYDAAKLEPLYKKNYEELAFAQAQRKDTPDVSSLSQATAWLRQKRTPTPTR